MGRSRASAKKAGSTFERVVADYLADAIDDRIDRRVKTGSLDKGDIAGVRDRAGRRVVIECKDVAKPDLSGWVREAHVEAVNDNAVVGVVVAKRRGVGAARDQYVIMTLSDLAILLGADTKDI